MKNKKSDVRYCGVDAAKIAYAEPIINWESVYHFKRFVNDRYSIHKKKDVEKLPQPWTKNPVLKEFKFTNVRREHDRQSKYLIENISTNPNLTLEDKIVNSFMFRAWNNWDTLKDFGFPYPAKKIYSPKLKHSILPKFEQLNAAEPNRLWYSNAYRHGGTICAWKFANADREKRPFEFGNDLDLGDDKYDDWEPNMPLRPFHVGVWLGPERLNIVAKLAKAKNQAEAFKVINSVRGLGEFVAYQIFVDLTYIKEFPFSENEFVIAGPGCKIGLDHIFIDRGGMSYEECIFWLRDEINDEDSLFNSDKLRKYCESHNLPNKEYVPEQLFSDLPLYDRKMNVMSIENCMCELSKYIKAVKGTGRPRNKYKPYVERTAVDDDRADILKKIEEAGR